MRKKGYLAEFAYNMCCHLVDHFTISTGKARYRIRVYTPKDHLWTPCCDIQVESCHRALCGRVSTNTRAQQQQLSQP